METQSWVGRTQFQPHLVRLHPFERQIGVAYKNKIMVNDWSRSTLQSYVPTDINAATIGGSLRGGGGTTNSIKLSSVTAATAINLNSWVSALEFINGHDSTLILAGYDDGCVRIWRPSDATSMLSSTDGKEARLLTAWQGMADITTNKFQSIIAAFLLYNRSYKAQLFFQIHFKWWRHGSNDHSVALWLVIQSNYDAGTLKPN